MMPGGREELREQLVAALEAAPEMAKGDREHLADVFLDRLSAGYLLVPRDITSERSRPDKPAGRPPWRARWAHIALAVAFVIFVLPPLLIHFPILLLVVVIVFLTVRHVRSRRSSAAASG